jgi:hypothetical protein
MTDRPLNVYHFTLIDREFTFTPQHQADVYVAAETQKRAAELFGVTPHEMTERGGTTGQKPVLAMCRAEPGVVFVERQHGLYSRRGEVADLEKVITLDMRDEDLYGRETEDSAFGVVEINRFSGGSNLFMVDYDTGHGIALVISTATLNRSGASDRVHQRDEIIRVEMSEVQFARMIGAQNSGGTPCTLRRYHHPKTGEFLTPKMPDKHAANVDTFRAEVTDRAQKALTDLADARARVTEIMKGGSIRKGDLAEVEALLSRAYQQATNNLPYVAERAKETIHDALEHGKAEIDAHIEFAMARLGERALGERLQAALAAGTDLAQVGRSVALVLDDRSEEQP